MGAIVGGSSFCPSLTDGGIELERARLEDLAMETRFRTQQAKQCDIEEQYGTLFERRNCIQSLTREPKW
ncbi:hypothetical protein niasHT_034564 [Heterodera trifolii]|uniref:Uncharacterized protein n=1 Tax=Heterodera trifolii TaxID=157864 RepID=A0ABD2IRA8_9BILA